MVGSSCSTAAPFTTLTTFSWHLQQPPSSRARCETHQAGQAGQVRQGAGHGRAAAVGNAMELPVLKLCECRQPSSIQRHFIRFKSSEAASQNRQRGQAMVGVARYVQLQALQLAQR